MLLFNLFREWKSTRTSFQIYFANPIYFNILVVVITNSAGDIQLHLENSTNHNIIKGL